MKYLLAQALTVLLPLAPPLAEAGAETDPGVLLPLASSLMKVEVQRVQGGYSLGSGVAVAPDEVLTNCHVTRDADAVYVLRGGRRWRAEGQAADVEHDLCLLRLPGLAAPAVALGSSRALWLGETVTALGYTGGTGLQHTVGRVVALHRLDGARVVQSSNAFTSGASGGALFDEQMRLVGILTFRLRGGAAHYFSSPLDWLQPLRDGGRFAPLQPLAAGHPAYWERVAAAQPDFLRAAVLERERRWDELDALAQDWTRSDTDDPEPWYLRGVALSGLHHWPESQRALERSLQLEPAAPLAWFQLGLVHAEQGRLDRARQARARLQGLDADLAAELGHAIDSH